MPDVDVLPSVVIDVMGRLAAAPVGRLFQKAPRKMLEQDLADIAATAEASRDA